MLGIPHCLDSRLTDGGMLLSLTSRPLRYSSEILPFCFWYSFLSESANELYDWTTATGRRILVPTFADRGVSRDQRGGKTTAVNLSFLDRTHHFFFQVVPHSGSRSWVDPVPDPLLLGKSGGAGNRTRDLLICSQELWPLDHRDGREAETIQLQILEARIGKTILLKRLR
jgi:hypothetical protein